MGLLSLFVLALAGLYVVLAAAAHDRVVLGLPGAYPADAVAFSAAGLVVMWRRRNHPAGWVMFALGVGLLIQTDGGLLAIVHYRRHVGPAALGPVAVVTDLLWVPMLAVLPVTIALFPNGRLPVRRAGVVLTAVGVGAVVTSAYFYIHAVADLAHHRVVIDLTSGDLAEFDSPHGALAWWYVAWSALVIGGLLAAFASLIIKFRQEDGDTRQQLRWFIYGAAVAALAVIPAVVSGALSEPQNSLANQLPSAALAVALVALPVSVVIGVLRYRLYDLNLVVSRSISYAMVAAGITAGYLAVVALFSVTVSAGTRNPAVSVLATLVAAAMFQPLRVGAQRLANRIVYRKRATPYEALSAFADQLGSTPELDTVLSRVASVLADASGARQVTVWLTSHDDELRAMATWPAGALPEPINRHDLERADDPATFTEFVTVHGELLGGISMTKRAGDPITQTDRQLLHQLAAQAGLALRNSKLTTDLQLRLEDLQASRRRLITAQDDARRHIERDLHDGAQQHLIVLNMKLGRLQNELAQAEQPAAENVTHLQREVDRAIESIRALAHGIFPTLLVDGGLMSALRSQLRNAPLPVHLDGELRDRYPADVEAAAYFCAMEALQNVYRHAAVSCASVRLAHRGDCLLVEVNDDGCGFVPTQRSVGTGLTNIRDRAESLGGRVVIRSAPCAGTSVTVELPTVAPPSQRPDQVSEVRRPSAVERRG